VKKAIIHRKNAVNMDVFLRKVTKKALAGGASALDIVVRVG
jgi:hypothetical protein